MLPVVPKQHLFEVSYIYTCRFYLLRLCMAGLEVINSGGLSSGKMWLYDSSCPKHIALSVRSRSATAVNRFWSCLLCCRLSLPAVWLQCYCSPVVFWCQSRVPKRDLQGIYSGVLSFPWPEGEKGGERLKLKLKRFICCSRSGPQLHLLQVKRSNLLEALSCWLKHDRFRPRDVQIIKFSESKKARTLFKDWASCHTLHIFLWLNQILWLLSMAWNIR